MFTVPSMMKQLALVQRVTGLLHAVENLFLIEETLVFVGVVYA